MYRVTFRNPRSTVTRVREFDLRIDAEFFASAIARDGYVVTSRDF